MTDTFESYKLFNLHETCSKPLVVMKAEQFNLRHGVRYRSILMYIISEKNFILGGQLKQGQSYVVISSIKLHNYTKENIRVVGLITMPLLVVAGERQSLTERNWLSNRLA